VLLGATTSAPRAAPRFEGDVSDAYFNSAVLLDGDGTIHGRYDKNYLLIGGEYIPFSEYFPWIYKLIPAAGDLEPGRSLDPVVADLWGQGPVRIGVLVCYEGILPGFARGLAAGEPHVIVNMTNDDWFGRTAERYLHFALTIPRAIEHRRAFARPTLTGVSAFVDPAGRIVSQTPVTGEDTLLEDVPLLTLPSLYPRIGDVFAWLCTVVLGAAYAFGRWRRGV
jgi:apolipoprotein N-acyltransferase